MTLTRAVAAYGYGSRLLLPTAPLCDAVFNELVAVAERHQLLGGLAQAAADGGLAITEGQRRILTDRHTLMLRHALRVERLLLRTAEQLDRAGIEFRVIKGLALAHTVYADPSWRVFGDLDLLVETERFEDAVRIGTDELGGVQMVPELRPGFDKEFGKEALVRIADVELDLHRTFVTGPFGLTIELDRLFESSTSVEIGGRVTNALDPLTMFLHACYNAAVGDYPVRLCSLRDLLVAHEELRPDLGAVERMASDWSATAVVQRAAAVTMESLAIEAGSPLAHLARLPVSRRESLLLRSYLTSARSYSRPLASLAVIRGIRPRFRYARALLAPSEEYLHSRGWTERAHLRRAYDRLRRSG